MTSRSLLLMLGLALLVAGTCHGDVVSDICGACPAGGLSYGGVLQTINALSHNPRVSTGVIGRSHGGRDIPVAIVHDPEVPLDSTVRIFIIARQHGTEASGTYACLGLLKHFATSQGDLEKDLLQQMALIVVPVANPDGMTAGRRVNGGGADLNRDWGAMSQPETRALSSAVKRYQPHALIDMHELPATSPKPSYRDNFIQTIGRDARLPLQLSSDCTATSAKLASWMGQCRIPLNVFYDAAGENWNLCHRYFGLGLKIPSYLFEAKCGPGRDLKSRTRFHVLGTLVVANYALHRYYQAGDDTAVAEAPKPSPDADGVPEQPVTVRLTAPADQQVARGQLPLVAEVTGPPGHYVTFNVDGTMKALTNTAPHTYLLDTTTYGDGLHQVAVQVCDATGRVLTEATSMIVVDNKPAVAE